MYKTVRKGDASLQYTILPQTDQFSASGFPQNFGKPRPRIVRYTMGTLMILIVLSCVATPFLMNQNDHSLFASTVLAMGRVGGHNRASDTVLRNSSKSPTKDPAPVNNKNRNRITPPTDIHRRKDLEDGTTSVYDLSRVDDEQIFDRGNEDFPSESSSTQRPKVSFEPEALEYNNRPTSRIPTSPPSTSSMKTFASTTSPTEVTRTWSAASASKKPKMPRVTLKLRENETIPQMYMKAGIASYKKGNITTSVLAHGLSLEGLIFKTPEGTIKPWPQKWFFTDPSSDFQWKGSNEIYVILAGVAILASISLSLLLMILVQRNATRRQRHCVEEPEEAEDHEEEEDHDEEEDKSTLLGIEI